jgi:hypothetical protein
MVEERRRERRTEDDRIADRFADSLAERRRRAALRQQIQSEDLDVAPVEVERLVRLRLAAVLGGKARAKSLSSARRRSIARRAARARWGAK